VVGALLSDPPSFSQAVALCSVTGITGGIYQRPDSDDLLANLTNPIRYFLAPFLQGLAFDQHVRNTMPAGRCRNSDHLIFRNVALTQQP
jgi:hypothetical protein